MNVLALLGQDDRRLISFNLYKYYWLFFVGYYLMPTFTILS